MSQAISRLRLKVGDVAPMFECEWPDGDPTQLLKFRGKTVVLFFVRSLF